MYILKCGKEIERWRRKTTTKNFWYQNFELVANCNDYKEVTHIYPKYFLFPNSICIFFKKKLYI